MDPKEQLITSLEDQKKTTREIQREIYKYRFYEFNKEIVGWRDLYEPLNKPLCDWIQERAGQKQLLVELPRGTFKSSTVTIGYTLWKMVNNPNVRVLIVNATYEMVKKFVGQLQDHLRKNQNLIDIYGDLAKDAELWSADTIKLKTDKSYETKEPTVFGYGMQGNLVSTHFDVIILDDLVNWDNISTSEQVHKVISFYKSTLDLLDPNGELIVIGTPYSYADLYAWIENSENEIHEHFDIYRRPAFTGDWFTGDLLFPTRLDWDRLKKLRSAEGPSHFASQYMLTPVLPEDAIFKYDFKYYDETDLRGVDLLTFMTVDPALSTASDADQTAMVVVSVDVDGNWYVRDLLVGRYGPMDLIKELIYMDEKWKPLSIGIEEVAFQKALSIFLQEEVKRRNKKPMPIKALKPERGRTTGMFLPRQYRIQSLEPRYAEGQILHNQSLKHNYLLEDQLRRFPRNDHDDVIDALAYMDVLAFPPRQRGERSEREAKGREYLY